MTTTPSKSAIAAVALGLVLGGCKTGNMVPSLLGAADLMPHLDTTASRQRELGEAAAEYVNDTSLRTEDVALESHLNAIMRKLVAAAGVGEDYRHVLYVIEDSQANAFTPGGGPVFVTTGLLRALETEGQVAAVIAHEIAHVTLSHVVHGMRYKAGMQMVTDFGSSAVGLRKLVKDVYDYSVLAGTNGHGRDYELEADQLGLATLVSAGYDPQEMIAVFEVLARMYGERSEQASYFHGSHSLNDKRITALKELIAEDYGELDRAKLIRDTPEFRRIKARYMS